MCTGVYVHAHVFVCMCVKVPKQTKISGIVLRYDKFYNMKSFYF
jgi:hypothetical protein